MLKHHSKIVVVYECWKFLYERINSGRCSVKKVFFLLELHIVDIGWPVLDKKVILTGDCFFPMLFY